MKRLKRAYYYLFYQLYRWYEKGPSVWWSEWKAGLSMDAVILFIFLQVFIYYKICINPYIHLSERNIDVIVVVLLITGFNYFIFHHRDQWKDIVKEFDQLPKRTNRIGGWIVFGVVLLIIANMIFAFYQMSLVDWSKYR